MSIEWEIEELAYLAMGMTEEEAELEINEGDIEEAIYAKYMVDFDMYCEIVKDLLPFTQPITTAITGKELYAFVDTKQQRIICRMEV